MSKVRIYLNFGHCTGTEPGCLGEPSSTSYVRSLKNSNGTEFISLFGVLYIHISAFFSVFGVDERKKLETALLGKRAQFQCNVQSSDASEVTLWWQFGGQNLTTLTTDDDQENRHHAITGGIF